jgi:hypothetical protein
MKLGQVQKDRSIYGDWQVRKIFGWLKPKPNPELVKIESKLDQLNQLTAINAENQAVTLAQFNDKAENAAGGQQNRRTYIGMSVSSASSSTHSECISTNIPSRPNRLIRILWIVQT